MKSYIRIEQDDIKLSRVETGEMIYYIVATCGYFIIWLLFAYNLVADPEPDLAWLLFMILTFPVMVLLTGIVLSSIFMLHFDLDGRALSRFHENALRSRFPPLRTVSYEPDEYRFLLARHTGALWSNLPITITIPVDIMNGLVEILKSGVLSVKYLQGNATVETRNRKLEVALHDGIAVDLFSQLAKTEHHQRLFYAYLKWARDHPRKKLTIKDIHPLQINEDGSFYYSP